MKKGIEIAKKEGLNYQAIIVEEAQTDIKMVIKRALISKINYNTMRKELLKVIKQAVKDLDSESLKDITKVSLQHFAERLYRQSLVAMGIPTTSVLLAYGYLRANMNLPSVVKQFNTSLAIPGKTFAEDIVEIAQPTGVYNKEYMKRVESALSELTKTKAKYDAHISLRNIAEMTVRYEDAIGNIESLKAQGVNLVQSSRHANCSKRCEPWQGGYYTLDNTYQVVDGIQFQPLSNATDIYYTTKAGKTYKNGHITGYNCRHRLFPYRKGYEQPMVSAKVIKQQREIDHTMRKFERDIRYYKEKALMYKGINNDIYVKAKNKASRLNIDYIEYAKSNSRAYYPSRTDIF